MRYQYKHPEWFENMEIPDFNEMSGTILIYGAGLQGALAKFLFDKMKIDILGFCDSDQTRWGTLFMGKNIYSPRETKVQFPDAAILVTPYNHEPAYQFVKNTLGFDRVYTCASLFMEFDGTGFEELYHPDWYRQETLSFYIDRYMRKLANFYDGEKEKQKYALDIAVTERCTLRCKNCTSLMPYYKNPVDSDWNDVKVSLDKLLPYRNFEYITIEGGEIFLWQPLPLLLEYLAQCPTVESVYPITNGTILPNKDMLAALRHEKFTVRLSDYGEHSTKIEQLKRLLENHKIKYTVALQKWRRFSHMTKEPRTGKALQAVVDDCCKCYGKGVAYFQSGTLYRCPFQANIENLGILSKTFADSIDLMSDHGLDLQKRIDDYLMHPSITNVCQYCYGRGYTNEEVPVAEQLQTGEVAVMVRED